MARFKGKVDLSELKGLEKRFQDLDKKQIEYFNEELVKEKTKLFLSNVVKLTPVGQYTDGRVGGTLRKSWNTDTEMKIVKRGKKYEILARNNTQYASYVNFGRRKPNGGWVNGQFFMERAAEQTNSQFAKVGDKKLFKLLKEAIDGN